MLVCFIRCGFAWLSPLYDDDIDDMIDDMIDD